MAGRPEIVVRDSCEALVTRLHKLEPNRQACYFANDEKSKHALWSSEGHGSRAWDETRRSTTPRAPSNIVRCMLCTLLFHSHPWSSKCPIPILLKQGSHSPKLFQPTSPSPASPTLWMRPTATTFRAQPFRATRGASRILSPRELRTPSRMNLCKMAPPPRTSKATRDRKSVV